MLALRGSEERKSLSLLCGGDADVTPQSQHSLMLPVGLGLVNFKAVFRLIVGKSWVKT